MLFSVTTTEKSGILQACERYTRLGDTTITGTAAYLADFTNYCNETNRELWIAIFKSYGGWQYEDSNQSDLPAAFTNLTSGQTSYALPSTALTVKGIEVKDSSGVWRALQPITEEEIRVGVKNNVAGSGQLYVNNSGAMGNFLTTNGTPLYYQLVGATARIFPASNWTQASSFKVFFDRGSLAFVTTDINNTTKTPGFASEFHDLIPLGASLIWFELNSPDDSSYTGLRNRYDRKKKDLEVFYKTQSSRLFTPRLKARQDSTR